MQSFNEVKDNTKNRESEKIRIFKSLFNKKDMELREFKINKRYF